MGRPRAQWMPPHGFWKGMVGTAPGTGKMSGHRNDFSQEPSLPLK